MKKFTLFLLLIIGGILLYNFWPEKELRHPAGMMAPDDPVQISVKGPAPWQKDDYTITPLAEFSIKAFVLSTNHFSVGRESDLSPIDLALGWGQMSNQGVIDGLDISQSNRWYHWKAKVLVIPVQEINTHSANMHIIPADENIENKLDELYKGCIIELKGFLVSVKAKDGWHWTSSLSRDDTGGGACELVWVNQLDIIEK